jgi:hypothetical protein
VSHTLLRLPRSSLSCAYMRQCAALLAAILAGLQQPGAPQAAARGKQQQQPAYEQPAALALQVVQFLQHLLRVRTAGDVLVASLLAPACSAGDAPSRSSGDASSSANMAAAATAMLQQVSTCPGTAMLLTLAAAQCLLDLVEQQQHARASLAAARLPDASSGTQLPQQLQEAATMQAVAVQAAHSLLDDLVSTAWF